MTVTFHASPVERSRALLIAAPFVLIVAACTDGVKASEIGRSNEPRRGPVLAFGAVDAAGVPPHAAMSRPAASAHPSGPRRVLRIHPLLRARKRPYHCPLSCRSSQSLRHDHKPATASFVWVSTQSRRSSRRHSAASRGGPSVSSDASSARPPSTYARTSPISLSTSDTAPRRWRSSP